MKILVVDDERDVEALFQQRFRKEIKNGDLYFEFAFSGEEALAYLRQNQKEALLILSDINMPGMNGLELLEYIKQEFQKPVPVVIMITAYGDVDNHTTAKSMGPDDFLTNTVILKNRK